MREVKAEVGVPRRGMVEEGGGSVVTVWGWRWSVERSIHTMPRPPQCARRVGRRRCACDTDLNNCCPEIYPEHWTGTLLDQSHTSMSFCGASAGSLLCTLMGVTRMLRGKQITTHKLMPGARMLRVQQLNHSYTRVWEWLECLEFSS
ncbi:hypothetical protein J6590_063235 [Homalodisca vitripennis]|nr:hypothetical protein J6590_063235 [Homalodisca vitripennis]